MKLLHSKFLSKQWEDKLLSKILQDHLCPGQDFLTWATKLQQQNCILQNTDSQLNRKQFRKQISVAVDMDLHITAQEAKVNKATSLCNCLDICIYFMRWEMLCCQKQNSLYRWWVLSKKQIYEQRKFLLSIQKRQLSWFCLRTACLFLTFSPSKAHFNQDWDY